MEQSPLSNTKWKLFPGKWSFPPMSAGEPYCLLGPVLGTVPCRQPPFLGFLYRLGSPHSLTYPSVCVCVCVCVLFYSIKICSKFSLNISVCVCVCVFLFYSIKICSKFSLHISVCVCVCVCLLIL